MQRERERQRAYEAVRRWLRGKADDRITEATLQNEVVDLSQCSGEHLQAASVNHTRIGGRDRHIHRIAKRIKVCDCDGQHVIARNTHAE